MADHTWPSVVAMYALIVFFAGGALLALVHAVRTGAVATDETPKLRMMQDED